MSGRTLFEKRVLPEPLSEKLTGAFIIFSEKCFAGKSLFVKRVSPAPLSEKLEILFIFI